MTRKLLAVAAIAAAALVTFVWIDPAEAASTSIAQIKTAFNPVGTAMDNAAIVVKTGAYATSEPAIQVGDATAVFSVDKEGDTEIAGRLNFPAHANGVGINIPTEAGACTAKTGDAAGDICLDTTGGVLYARGAAAWGAIGTSCYPLTAQSLPTFDPAGTTDAQASLYFDVASFEANEKAIATSTGFSVDEDGDVVSPVSITGATLVGTTSVTTPSLVIGATAVTSSAAEINKLDGKALGTSTITCADDAAGTTSLCSIVLKDADGAALTVRTNVLVYLSDDANGDSLVGTAPSGGWATTTDGLMISMVTNKAAWFTSESNGQIDFTITEAGAKNVYVVLVTPLGGLIVSSVDAFN